MREFATVTGAGDNKIVVLVMDGAGWHRTPNLEIPEGIELMILPPYSPELQPAECLWSLVDEPFVNRALDSLEQLEAILAERCRVWSDQFQSAIQALTHFSW